MEGTAREDYETSVRGLVRYDIINIWALDGQLIHGTKTLTCRGL